MARGNADSASGLNSQFSVLNARRIQTKLLGWYEQSARDLPWRGAGRTPYRVLVSEFMLQQTQVATVIPYFERWMTALPMLQALADAEEQAVLRLWQGLGYYSRARNLRKAAKAIIAEHGGQVPQTIETLLTLPGVGRYTAGAIASIAFDKPVPILDGNVIRVLCRVDRIDTDPRTPETQKRLWQGAATLVPDIRPGDFNSALMELGATLCTPRNPQCLLCPIRTDCETQKAGLQEQIPPRRKAKINPLIERDVYRITNAQGRFLIEQRPTVGRWAGLWQFITRQPGIAPPLSVVNTVELDTIDHALTHRRYRFRIFACQASGKAPAGTHWATLDELDRYPMPRPHLRIRDM